MALQESLPRVGDLSHELLAVEARRVAGLRRLRLSFGEATRKLQLRTPLVGGFERWHFGWLLAVSGAADPLLPLASSSTADAALASELEGAGASPVAAAAVTAALSRDADKEAEGMAAVAAGEGQRAEAEAETEGAIELSTASSGLVNLHCTAAAGGLKLTAEHLAKLRAMHARVRQATSAASAAATRREAEAEAEAEEALFRCDLARLLLRYKAIGARSTPLAIAP